MTADKPNAATRAWRGLRGLTQPLYVRIWLAVVLSVGVLTLVFAWLWRVNTDSLPQPREVLVRNEAGDVIGQAMSRPIRVPGQGIEFQIAMADGSALFVQFPPRPRGPGEPPPSRPWPRGPLAPFWLFGIAALAVALGIYPIIRRLTKRLEQLQRGVEQWGRGDLSTRINLRGQDEAATLAARFNEAAGRIEALLASQKSLLANASHELRSPLTRIRMGLELMGQAPSQSQRDEMQRSIGELDQLIEEILLASRLDASEADVGTVEQVDLSGLAAEECARIDAELDAQQVVVPGVAKLLRRLVRNLLENARRHGAADVSMQVSLEHGKAVARVSDRGPGVPVDQRERIFEPFYRLPGASERDGGVGLGLALVKSIALRHGGSVRCEDHAGGGACFVVELPASPAGTGH